LSRLLDKDGAALWVIGIVVVVRGLSLAFAGEARPGAGLKVMGRRYRAARHLAGRAAHTGGQERGAG
jgi:hypothetical protein